MPYKDNYYLIQFEPAIIASNGNKCCKRMCVDFYLRLRLQFCVMKYIPTILFFLFFSIFAQAQTVVAVHDGDTYSVLQNGKIQIVRLQNVDAPELGQFFGNAVRDSAAKLLLKRKIDIEDHGFDLYGRQLVAIFIDGKSLDSVLISNGWAWFYAKYSHNLQLNIYEAAARKKGLGLWKCEHNVPPWIWRKLSKRNKRLYEVCR